MTKVYYNENDPKAAAWLRELIAQKLIADGDVERDDHDPLSREGKQVQSSRVQNRELKGSKS